MNNVMRPSFAASSFRGPFASASAIERKKWTVLACASSRARRSVSAT